MDERYYWLGFSVFSGIGPHRFAKLLSCFGSAKEAWTATVSQLQEAKLGSKTTALFDSFRKTFVIDAYAETLKKKQVSFFILNDKEYPKLLKQITNPPFVLYYRGKFAFNHKNNQNAVAIVGTRKITQYGRQVTELFTRDLVAGGCVIVSGLAVGVDATAHKTTLDEKGKTIAVLGSGVDICAPSSNRYLYDAIIENNGAIVSEFPLGTQPSKGSFPSRNRIIAGLSRGVLVTEGAEDSGALITATYAHKFGRKVFAVPGPITSSLSQGPLNLIKKGAKLVMSAEDILEELGINSIKRKKSTKSIKGDTEEEQKILDLLQNEPLHFDQIVKNIGRNSSQIGTILSLLEIKGYIRSKNGKFFLQS